MKIKKSPLQKTITLLERQASQESLSLQEIIEILAHKGSPLLIVFLSLPFCQPLQIPGGSTPFGLVILCLGIQALFKKPIWLPKKIGSKRVSQKLLTTLCQKLLWLSEKVEKISHHRLAKTYQSPLMQIFLSATICFLGLFLTIPLPLPLANIPAAWALFFIGFGLLEEDGLFILIGYLLSLIALAVFVGVIVSIIWIV
jgi:hypothetical protein